MRFTTIFLGENKVEVFNNLLGIETIKVNGRIVSRKFSIFGAEHIFTLNENEESVEHRIDFGYGFNGIVFSLYRENKPIIESPKNGCLLFIAIFFIALTIGIINDFVLN